jgi:hypothetical protein
MSLQVVIGQLEIGWDPACTSERVISFLRAETRPGWLCRPKGIRLGCVTAAW